MSQHCDLRAVFVLRPAEHCRVIEDADLYNVGADSISARETPRQPHIFSSQIQKTPRRVFHSAV
jgi:hypothetical protein